MVYLAQILPDEVDGTVIDDRDDSWARLVETRNLLDNILASSTEYSIIGEDLDRRIVLWNEGARRNYGYSEQEVVGRPSDLLHDASDLESGIVERLHSAALANGTAEGRFLRVRKDGTRFPASVVITRREDARRRPIGFVLISRDVSRDEEADRARDEARLRELELLKRQDEFKSEFLRMAAHEFRTPLTALRLQLELLQRSGLPQNFRANVEIARRSEARLSNLTEQLLDTTRLQAGQLTLNLEPVDVDAIVRKAIDMLRPQAEANGVHLQADLGGLGHSQLDALRVSQIVVNLLENAIKFTPRGGQATVSTRADAGRLTLTVTDTGPGIAAADLGKLFMPFSRLPMGQATRGSGLGLYIVRTLAELHAGEASVASEGPGRGSSFTVTIPIVRALDVPVIGVADEAKDDDRAAAAAGP